MVACRSAVFFWRVSWTVMLFTLACIHCHNCCVLLSQTATGEMMKLMADETALTSRWAAKTVAVSISESTLIAESSPAVPQHTANCHGEDDGDCISTGNRRIKGLGNSSVDCRRSALGLQPVSSPASVGNSSLVVESLAWLWKARVLKDSPQLSPGLLSPNDTTVWGITQFSNST